MSRVTAVIQAHPLRKHLHGPILKGLSPMETIVSLHSSEPPNPWEGYQIALERGASAATKPSHVLVLQDDVVVCRNLPRAVWKIAKRHPEDPVVLFHSRLPMRNSLHIRQAQMTGARYVLHSHGGKFVPVVALLWPVSKIAPFLEWASTAKLPGWPRPARSDDAVVGQWARSTQQNIWITVPSLVQHPDTSDSLIGRQAHWGKDKGRVAMAWIGDQDALDFDWLT